MTLLWGVGEFFLNDERTNGRRARRRRQGAHDRLKRVDRTGAAVGGWVRWGAKGDLEDVDGAFFDENELDEVSGSV